MKKQHGFTLVELAIVMVIVGLIIVAAIPSVKYYRNTADFYETREKMNVVQEALREYFGRYGRYPCPADEDLGPEDANYGLEQCPAVCPVAGPIVCTNLGGRDADNDSVADNILIGAIPIRSLVYPEFPDIVPSLFTPVQEVHGYDNWFGKFTYAVSESMTDVAFSPATPANVQSGAINVQDEFGQDILDPPGSAHYVIVSHGDNNRGAFTIEGGDVGDCDINAIMGSPQPANLDIIGTPGLAIELENCDRDDANFISALRSTANNDGYFDDQVYFNASNAFALWRQSNFSPATETYLYNTNFGNVGIGTNIPNSKLDVNGNIRAETSVASEVGYCDPTQDTKCLEPALLGGNTKPSCATKYGPGFVAIGIENNELVCIELFPAGTPVSFVCPTAGEFVTSFSNLGNVVCSAP